MEALAFIDDATADSSRRMNCEAYRAVLSPQIQENTAKHSFNCIQLYIKEACCIRRTVL